MEIGAIAIIRKRENGYTVEWKKDPEKLTLGELISVRDYIRKITGM